MPTIITKEKKVEKYMILNPEKFHFMCVGKNAKKF